MKFFRVLKNLFTKTAASPAIQEVAASVENTVVKSAEMPTAAKIDSLGGTIRKLKEKAGITQEIEAKPGFRKFRTVEGDIITVGSKTGCEHTITIDRIPRRNSTLEISRDVQDWNRLKTSEFLGLRRDSVWGKDGLTKTTTVQTTGLTLPAGTSRELRPEFESFAYRNGWLSTIERPQICPKNTTTKITKPSNAVEYDFTDAIERDLIKRLHRPNTRFYTGSKYNDRYAEYRTPILSPYQ